MAERPTIDDVRLRANVSKGTVYRALSGSGAISPAKRQQVLRAARALRYDSTQTIGVVLPDISDPFFSSIAATVIADAKAAGYSSLVVATNENAHDEIQAVETLNRRLVDGVVAAPTFVRDGDLKRNTTLAWRDLIACGAPVVFFDRPLERVFEADTVTINNRVAAKGAAKYLLELGHRRIAVVSGPTTYFTLRERLAGVQDAYAEEGVDFDPQLAISSELDQPEPAVEGVLALTPRPTAVFALNDVHGAGLVRRLRSEAAASGQWRVPDDISVLVFDHPEWTDLTTPAITVVDQHPDRIAATAVSLLIERLRNRRDEDLTDPASLPRHIELEAELLKRQSCQAPSMRSS